MLTNKELTRYRRQISLAEVGVEGQQRLKAASVLVIGAGGIGTPIILYLAAAGIGKIGICDSDTVELSNLHRQIIYQECDVGLAKAVIAAKRLQALNSDIECIGINQAFTEHSLSLTQHYDVLIDGSDNFKARYLANHAAVKYGIPLISASLFRSSAQLGVFNRNGSACYQCLYPIPPSDAEAPNCADAGVMGAVVGVIGTLAASETIKIILDSTPSPDQLVVFDSADISLKKYQLKRDQHCPCCGGKMPLAPRNPKSPCREAALEISADQLRKLLSASRIMLIDVRMTVERINLGYIGGDIHIPLENIADAHIEQTGETAIVVYCQHGMRSQIAAMQLKNRGFAEVYSLAGGLQGWFHG